MKYKIRSMFAFYFSIYILIDMSFYSIFHTFSGGSFWETSWDSFAVAIVYAVSLAFFIAFAFEKKDEE